MAQQPQTVGQTPDTPATAPAQVLDQASETSTRGITRGHWTTVIVVSAVISVVAVLIGTYKFQIGPAALVLLPIIWAVIIGGIVGTQRVRRLSASSRAVATLLLEIGIIVFLARLGLGIGPSLAKITEIGPAVVLQEAGHIFGTVILALPIAVALGLGRVAIGATWSIDRESFLAYALQRFGVRSGEYRGVFSVWLLGSLFGAVFISLLAGTIGNLGILDPRALALGLGLGSASMMLGGVGALSILYPQHAGEIAALAALSNLVTNIVGFYAGVFLSLPLGRALYRFWSRVFGRNDEGKSLRKLAVETEAASEGEAPVAVENDPTVRTSPRTLVFAYAIMGVIALVTNAVGTKSFHPEDILGVVVLLALTGVSFALARLLPSVPSSVWVLSLATIVSAPFMPTAGFIAGITQHLDSTLVGLPSLTLIGLTLGRDVAALKSLSWKIIIVALVTYSASFIAAAVLGQLVLH
ncbi:DUF3100 domain-containing protein [Sinomonas sp. JGH33]|uniref:DUF3100 domain-containing protein n=1 Tax=Sinomonas terricola TaxID=3110330 RepID=A0ABU5T2T7_9MICC|nr:DUF3100 domain-containing protein [Sinomonas sp. JGH33]MEA5453976.1 DUF3100 domain-containing protein [Sinomonas sp. JGH33]